MWHLFRRDFPRVVSIDLKFRKEMSDEKCDRERDEKDFETTNCPSGGSCVFVNSLSHMDVGMVDFCLGSHVPESELSCP